ncbi:His-Xaa-Ser system protein HxsD [Pseudomonas sp. SDO528_S397]
MAYSLAHTLSILIRQQGQQLVLDVTPNDPTNLLGYAADTAKALVLRHLNDFALRDQIAQETAGLREILASVALQECGR